MTAMPQNQNGAGVIEKIMTLSQAEYAKSISAFAGDEAGKVAATGAPVVVPVGSASATITFTKIQGFSFSGLIDMPRARVEIDLSAVSPADSDAFLRQFDIAFQRGGG
ncbi:MAG: hypothetical protein RIC14_04750 [Filomicrobium sp.]